MPTMRKERNMASPRIWVLDYEEPEEKLRWRGSGHARGNTHGHVINTARIPKPDGHYEDNLDIAWREQAECLNSHLNFTPNTYLNTTMVEKCMALCARCPVKSQCLQMAIESDDKYSICGGTTPEDRKAML